MATNSYGFINKRYPQPNTYEKPFHLFNAVYRMPDGKDILVEAHTHCLCHEQTESLRNIGFFDETPTADELFIAVSRHKSEYLN